MLRVCVKQKCFRQFFEAVGNASVDGRSRGKPGGCNVTFPCATVHLIQAQNNDLISLPFLQKTTICISFHHFNLYVENFPSYVPVYLYVC